MSAAVRVTGQADLGVWLVETRDGCRCPIGGWNGGEPTRVYRRFEDAAAFAAEHAETHTCPSWRASGEPCSPYCTDCGGRGWVA